MALAEKYVSVAGGGSHDGSSAANAWTLAEMISAAPTGSRVNVLSGSYSTGIASLPAGTVTAPNIFQGYHTVIGDLVLSPYSSMRSFAGTGLLGTTNWPVITGTGSLTASAFNLVRNLNITSALISASTLSMLTDSFALECVVSNTSGVNGGSGAGAINISSSLYAQIVGCDASTDASGGAATAINIGRGAASYCHATSAAGPAFGAAGVGGSLVKCVGYSSVDGASLNSTQNVVDGCTFWNISNAAIRQAGDFPVSVTNCLASNIKYLFQNATTVRDNLLMNNAAGNFKASGARWLNQGDYPDINPVVLTADPFMDTGNLDFRVSPTATDVAILRNAGLYNADLGAIQIASAGGYLLIRTSDLF